MLLELRKNYWGTICETVKKWNAPIEDPIYRIRSYVDWYILQGVDFVLDRVFFLPFLSQSTGVNTKFQLNAKQHEWSLKTYDGLLNVEKELQAHFGLNNLPILHFGKIEHMGEIRHLFNKEIVLSERVIEPLYVHYNGGHEVAHAVHDDNFKMRIFASIVLLFGILRTAQLVRAVFSPRPNDPGLGATLQVVGGVYAVFSMDKQREVRADFQGLEFLKKMGLLEKFFEKYPDMKTLLSPVTEALLEKA